MNLIKSYFQYVQDPVSALKNLLSQRSLPQACAGYFAAALGWVLFFNIGDGLSVAGLVSKLLILFVTEVTVGYLWAAVCGLFLDFSKAKVSSAELFCLVGSSGFIKGLLIVFALWSAMWPMATLFWLAPIALLLVFGLQLGYLTRGLIRVYDVPVATAITAWLLSLLPFLILLSLGVIFIIWGTMLLF